MKKRTVFLLCGGLAVLLLAGALLGPSVIGARPFQSLTSEEVQSAQVDLFPPGVSFTLTPEEIEELVPLLNELVVYRRDGSWGEYSGQLCRFTLTLADGNRTTVQAYSPFLIVDGVGRRTKYEPCEALNHFANSRGVSGALYLQSAIAGVMSCLGFIVVELPLESGVDVLVLRNGNP